MTDAARDLSTMPTDPAPAPARPGPPKTSSERYDFTLPSGRIASFLAVHTGDHVARATRLLKPIDQGNQFLLGFAIASVISRIDGELFRYEDTALFSGEDFMAIALHALSGKGPSSPTST